MPHQVSVEVRMCRSRSANGSCCPNKLFWSSYPTRGCLLRALRCPDRPGMARPVKSTSGISGEPQGLYERVSGRL